MPIDWDWLAAAGIETVVDVNDAGQVHAAERVAGLRYVKDPLVDAAEVPPAEQLDELVSLVVDEVRADRPVLVHCGFGKNRSGLVVVLAVRRLLGVDGRTALEHLRAVRTRAVNNATFASYVEGLPAPELAAR
nr:dual specificity protein phosphatase family protein [Motilibacter aurantiacus]